MPCRQDAVEAASILTSAKDSVRKTKGKAGAQAEEEDEPEPIDVIVDGLIGELEKGSAYERDTANAVFDLICGALRGSGMDLLLTVRASPPSRPSPNR